MQLKNTMETKEKVKMNLPQNTVKELNLLLGELQRLLEMSQMISHIHSHIMYMVMMVKI